MIEITKETFERHLPVFAAPDDKLFRACTSSIDGARTEVERLLGGVVPEGNVLEQAQRCICLEAAADAVPQLDLVLTPTGFGVVSNQNLAPASESRVTRLLERLERDACICRDAMLAAVAGTEDWGTKPVAREVISRLVWCPMVARSVGMTVDGRPVYKDGFLQLLPRICLAETAVQSVISVALYDKLLELMRTTDIDEQPAYALVLHRARKYVAVSVMDARPRSLAAVQESLQEALNINLNELPEYSASSQHAAAMAPRYENKQTDGTFFFS